MKGLVMADQEDKSNTPPASEDSKEDKTPPKEDPKDKGTEEKKDDDNQNSSSDDQSNDGDSSSDDDTSDSDGGSDNSDDQGGFGSDDGFGSSDEEEVSVGEEARKLIKADEAEKALGITASFESIADYMERHPALNKRQEYMLYLNVRASLAGVDSKASNVFPCLENYEQNGVFTLTSKHLRDRAETLKKNFGF